MVKLELPAIDEVKKITSKLVEKNYWQKLIPRSYLAVVIFEEQLKEANSGASA